MAFRMFSSLWIVLLAVTVSLAREPVVCDVSNGPCDCVEPIQLPGQSEGVTGFGLASSDAPINPNEDSCAGVGQCEQHSAHQLPPGPGRTALSLLQENSESSVIGDLGANPAGLTAAVEMLDSYSVNLCVPVSVSGVNFTFSAIQERDFAALPGADPDDPKAYEWIDFFVIVTAPNGDRFIAYEQHGTDPDSGDPGGSNAPIIGTVSNANAEGLQGGRDIFFDRAFETASLTFYFDGVGGFAYFGGSSVVLKEAEGVPQGACDSENGPCSCDPAAQLPLQSGGVTGYATTSNSTNLSDPDADSCAGVGQCLKSSFNELPDDTDDSTDLGRTHIPLTLNGATAGVVGDKDPNPEGLGLAVAQLDFYSVELCEPLCIQGVKFFMVAGQERVEFGAGSYEWLEFFVVLTLENGDRVIGYEQHGVLVGGEEKVNDPIIGSISNFASPGTQGDREIFFDEAFEVTQMRIYFNGTTGFSDWGGHRVELVECPSASIVIRQTGGRTELDESDDEDTDLYTVALGQEPSDVVDVDLVFDDDQIDADPDTLIFTPDDWHVEQTVSLQVVDDLVFEGNPYTTVVTHTAFGGGFDGVSADLIVTIHENDENKGGGPVFRRGDHDGNGTVDINDAFTLVKFQFLGEVPPLCLDASDADNSGEIDITDPINLLRFLFLGSFPLNETPPGPTTCGEDPGVEIDPDGAGNEFPVQPAVSLGCETYPNVAAFPGVRCE